MAASSFPTHEEIYNHLREGGYSKLIKYERDGRTIKRRIEITKPSLKLDLIPLEEAAERDKNKYSALMVYMFGDVQQTKCANCVRLGIFPECVKLDDGQRSGCASCCWIRQACIDSFNPAAGPSNVHGHNHYAQNADPQSTIHVQSQIGIPGVENHVAPPGDQAVNQDEQVTTYSDQLVESWLQEQANIQDDQAVEWEEHVATPGRELELEEQATTPGNVTSGGATLHEILNPWEYTDYESTRYENGELAPTPRYHPEDTPPMPDTEPMESEREFEHVSRENVRANSTASSAAGKKPRIDSITQHLSTQGGTASTATPVQAEGRVVQWLVAQRNNHGLHPTLGSTELSQRSGYYWTQYLTRAGGVLPQDCANGDEYEIPMGFAEEGEEDRMWAHMYRPRGRGGHGGGGAA